MSLRSVMSVEEFNKEFEGQFRIEAAKHSETSTGTKTTWLVEQWCPIDNAWWRILIPGPWRITLPAGKRPEVTAVLENAIRNWPAYVLIERDKYSDRHYAIGSTEDLGIVAVKILSRRLSEGYICDPKESPQPERPKTSREEAMQLKDASLKNLCLQQWEAYEDALASRDRDIQDHTEATLAAVEGNYEMAWEVLNRRRRYQYEGFDLEELISANSLV